jgi:hypothetical protein
MSDRSFVCATCGKRHPGLPTDYGFGLPDEVYALGYVERYLRSRSNSDLCTLDEKRYFLRGILPIPLVKSREPFCWGIWTEVSKQHHDLYVASFDTDMSKAPHFAGRLANDISGYGGTIGLQVEVQLRSGNDRPEFRFPARAAHALAREQRGGITRRRHHDILEAVGFFNEQAGA